MPTYKIKFYKDPQKAWRWRVQAANGQTVASSGQGYSRLAHCVKMARQLFAWFRN